MDGDEDHEITCSGDIYIDGVKYGLSKIKGRGNATWKESQDKKPYNITLDSKIYFPGVDSEKTKKWSLLAENLDRSLLGNRAGYHLAYESLIVVVIFSGQTDVHDVARDSERDENNSSVPVSQCFTFSGTSFDRHILDYLVNYFP